MFNAVFDYASDEEKDVLRRGQNAKPNSVAKNFSIADYKKATGLETLFGYLKLTDNEERLREIFQVCVKTLASNEANGANGANGANAGEETGIDL
jgi:ribonuclease-3 family protein